MQLLTAINRRRAGEILAQAFYRDPLWCYLLPNDALRADALLRSFQVIAATYSDSGQAYGAGEPLAGVAVWSRPQQRSPTFASLWRAGLWRLIVNPLTATLPRAIPIFGRFETFQQRYAPEPHFYLNTIGVAPEAQGRGLASALIRPFLHEADVAGQSVYTETMTPTNVPLYNHYGFACVEEYPVTGTNLRMWALYRAARIAAGEQRV